ncbi:diguanylate cyclase [Undibacterium sp. JH2W]|uniref:sensor domain-containing diguanylate cyclase n=1 Tax=Undibacterium sp. JH2W TaxID=3413037 RepID=UPI003BEF5E54
MLDTRPAWIDEIKIAAITCVVVLLACLLGIFSRSMGHLAGLWPANALLLGMFVRFPFLNKPCGWLGAVAAYIASEVLSGESWPSSLLLSAGNLACVIVGCMLFSWLDAGHRRLKHPLSVLYLALIAVTCAATAGIVNTIADSVLSNDSHLKAWTFWSVTELVNLLAILPVILSLPNVSKFRINRRRSKDIYRLKIHKLLPVGTLFASFALGIMLGGPGALAFPIPALLWCALSYGIFTTSIMTLLYSGWVLISMSLGYLPISIVNMNSRSMLLSIRTGVSMLALAPLTVASVMAAREELLRHLEYIAEHDALTGLLNRRAFYERALNLLGELAQQEKPVAVLMLDIDKFKGVNDNYGHAGGDQVLVAFARIASSSLRDVDMLGRIGGEEFAAILPSCAHEEADRIAQRIRVSLANKSIDIGDGQQISVTVSIGCTFVIRAVQDIEALLVVADKALYRAKENGRNRVEYHNFDEVKNDNGQTPSKQA